MNAPLEFNMHSPEVRDAYEFAFDSWDHAVNQRVIRDEVDETIVIELVDTFKISQPQALIMSSRALQDVLEVKLGIEIRPDEEK